VLEQSAIGSFTYIAAEENLGPAGGFALGMRRTLEDFDDEDLIVLVDDDDPPFFDDAFEQTVEFFAKVSLLHDRVAGVGISGGRFDWSRGRIVRIDDEGIHGAVEVDHVTGGGLPTFHVGAVRDIGVYDAALFFGFEELEYGLRVTRSGYRIYADGEQWRRRKAVKRSAGLLPSEDESIRMRRLERRVSIPTWRRYYSLRNLIHILRSNGYILAAFRVAVMRGLLKPLANLAVAPGLAWANLGLNARAIKDGWLGRLGRTVEPQIGPTSE
jgi:hypothetical protein